jgi:uncharacterized Zn finger protein
MTFFITCKKCGSECVEVSTNTNYEVEIDCQNCGNSFTGVYFSVKVEENKE